jgi:hypothetical protein
MSSAAFDTLRRKHPSSLPLITALQLEVGRIGRIPDAVVDERSIAQLLHERREVIEPLLVDLVKFGALRTMFFWICPATGGTIWQGNYIQEAPTWIRCEECRQEHFFSEQDVEVHFLVAGEIA